MYSMGFYGLQFIPILNQSSASKIYLVLFMYLKSTTKRPKTTYTVRSTQKYTNTVRKSKKDNTKQT